MSELTKTNKPQENIEENQLSSESESGTSSWESEPVTQRTTRQYYPVRESSRDSEPTAQDGQLQEISDSEMGRKEEETLGGSYGGFSDEPGSAERSGGSKEGSLQKGIPIDGYTGFDGDVLSLSSHLRHVSGETESGKERNETGDSASSDDDHASGGWEEGEKQDRNDDDDEIEEIDLTRDPLESKYLHRNIGESYVPTSNVLFLPSLSSLGSLGPASLGAVMGDLLGQAAGLDMGEDTGSDWVEEEVEGDSDEKETEEGVAEQGREPSSQEGLAQLFQTLKQQHEEQMRAQQKQHRTQISWLKNQLLTGGKTHSSHSHDMGSKAASHTRPHVQEAVKREGENKSQEKGDLLAPGRVDIEEVPLLDQGDDSSSETSTFVSGSLDNTQMTTWTDVHDQKQGQNESNVDQFVESGVSMPEGAILERMQQNFEDQRAAMQREYQAQVASLQREWHALQQRQTQQRQVVVDLLQQQDNRLQQQQASLAQSQQSQQQDADDMSSVYSDFTYWRLEEGDTYKDLPTSHSRGEQPHSLERDSLASEEPPIVATDTPLQGGVESPSQEGEVPGFHEGGMAKLVQSPRTSSRGKTKQAPPRSPQSSASSRIDLQEKYSRHIADLEAYYEGELDDLRKQLAQARLASSVVTERGMEKGPHPATTEKGGGRGAEKLQLHCQQLQTSLTAANSRIQDLENTVQALEDRLLEWPDRYSLANSTVEVLQKRADDLVRLVKQREEDFRKLEQENRTLQHSLLQAQQHQELQTTEGKKEQAMLGKLIAQYTNLTAQHEATQAELFKVQMNLSEANASISELKRTAVRQELEIKQLEGEKKKLLTPRDHPLTNSSFSSPLPLDVEPTSGPGYAKGHHENEDRVLGALRTKTPTTPQATPAYPTSNSPLTPGSAMRLSVEDRKFLRSADFNIFSGEDPRTSSTSTSQSPFSIPSDLRTTHSTSYKAPDVISPVQNSTTSPPSNSLVPPFDSDLDDRPLSPMMKASAQLDRWKSSGQSPRSRTSRTHPGSVNSLPGSQLHASEAPTRDTSSGERTNSVAQPVLYRRRSRDSTPLSSGGSSSAGTGKEVRGESTRHDVKSASPVGQAASFPAVRTGKKTNYERASTIGDHLQPGVNAGVNGGDPSLHVWAVHRSPNTAQLKGKQHRSKSSPRQQTAASAPAHSLSPGQAARRNLAKYSVKDALGGSGGEKGRKRSSPRRSLASSFKASEKKGSSSPPREGGLRKGEMSSKSVQTPTTNEDPLEAALQNVREGHVITRAEWENSFAEAKKSANKNASRMTSKTSDTPEAILQRLSKESKKLDALMLEKRNLEASLSHLPTSGPACAKKVKKQERLEERLDQVTREMGSVRMLLRKYNALNISF